MNNRRAVCVVEGDGDEKAVPVFFRNLLHHQGYFGLQVDGRAIKSGGYANLRRAAEFERYARIASKRRADIILFSMDADELCPVECARELVERAQRIVDEIKTQIGIVIFKPEFEVMFLQSICSIANSCPRYNIDVGSIAANADFEAVRDSKGRLKKACQGIQYKESRDQVRLIDGLDFGLLGQRSRTFMHAERVTRWMADSEQEVYPSIE